MVLPRHEPGPESFGPESEGQGSGVEPIPVGFETPRAVWSVWALQKFEKHVPFGAFMPCFPHTQTLHACIENSTDQLGWLTWGQCSYMFHNSCSMNVECFGHGTDGCVLARWHHGPERSPVRS